MARIFSNVVADIDNDLVSKFPADFDYIAMIKQLSEEAGVDVFMNGKDISMKGIWVAMERVHSMLTTSLGMYGTKIKIEHTSYISHHTDSPVHFQSELDSEEGRVERKANEENVYLYNEGENEEGEIEASGSSMEPSRSPVIKLEDTSNDNHDMQLTPPQLNDGVDEDHESREDFVHEKIDMRSTDSTGSKRKKVKGKQKNVDITDLNEKNTSIKIPYYRRERKCTECDFVATSNYHFKKHMDWFHVGTPTNCDICHKLFQSEKRMLKHRVSHNEPKHCCEVCGKMFKVKRCLLEHIDRTHNEGYVRPCFQCHLCPKTFVDNYVLSCHVKKDHLGQKKSFLCSECGKSFTLKHSLQEHMILHTGTRPNVCDVCGQSFNARAALYRHKVRHGERTEHCTICNKSFFHKQELKSHRRVHFPDTTEKPYSCRLCLKSFYDTSKTRQHLRLVHKINKHVSVWREDVISKKSSSKTVSCYSNDLPEQSRPIKPFL